jgi:hypothetical protein
MTTTWNPISGNLASTVANWSNGLPSITKEAIFDLTSSAACTMDISVIKRLSMNAGYGGTITLANDLQLTEPGANCFLCDAGTFVATGYKFQVDGKWNQSGAGVFTQTSAAGGSLYFGEGYTNTSTTAGNQFDSDDIILGYNQSGITFEMRNDDFKTRMNVTFTPTNTYVMTGRWYIDQCKAAGGTYKVKDNGSQQQWTDCNFDQMDEIDFSERTAINRVRLTVDGTQFDGTVNLYGCQLDTGAAFDIPATATYIDAGTINHWISGTAIGTIQGSVTCEDYNSGSSALNTRGGDMTVTGSLIVNDATTVWSDDGIQTNSLDVSNATAFSTGSLLVKTAGNFDADGTLGYYCVTSGDETFEATSTVTLGSVDRAYTGSATQTLTSDSNTGGSIFINKTGGDMIFADAVGGSGDLYRNAYNHTYNIQFLAASTNTFNDTHANGAGSFVANMISSVAATKFNMPLTVSLTTDFHAGWKDSNVTGAIKVVDTDTGADNGNNTVAGAEGLDFQSLPADYLQGGGLIGSVVPTLVPVP